MEPVIEPVSDMEEEEANKDEAESKNKQLLTRLMLVIVPGWIIGCQLSFHDDDYEHLHMAFRASRHQMDTDNGANHVYVDVAVDVMRTMMLMVMTVTWIQTHLPREITPVMQSTTDR